MQEPVVGVKRRKRKEKHCKAKEKKDRSRGRDREGLFCEAAWWGVAGNV